MFEENKKDADKRVIQLEQQMMILRDKYSHAIANQRKEKSPFDLQSVTSSSQAAGEPSQPMNQLVET